MTEHLLDAAQVGARGQEVRGELSERVRAGLPEHVGALQNLAQDVVKALAP